MRLHGNRSNCTVPLDLDTAAGTTGCYGTNHCALNMESRFRSVFMAGRIDIYSYFWISIIRNRYKKSNYGYPKYKIEC